MYSAKPNWVKGSELKERNSKRPWFDISVHIVRKLYYVHTIKWLYKNTTESQILPDTFKETKQWRSCCL